MFNKQNFCHVASNNRNEQKAGLFVYKTTDDLATVATSGYFNEKIIDINLHDLIIHEWHNPNDRTEVQYNMLCVIERTLENVGTAVILSKWEGDIEQYIEDTFVKKDGTSVMTGPLKFSAGSFRGAIAGGLNGLTFFKMDSEGNLTQIGSLSDTQFVPASDNTLDIGTNVRKIERIYLGKVNNGHDINVPVTNTDDTLGLKSQIDDAANSGEQLYTTGVWYAKMYAATAVPTGAEYEGRNYADFSQVDQNNDPIIVVYTYTSGAWATTATITPPKNHNGYMTITSKIWDITEQAGQQGGLVLWAHNQGTFTPYPRIVSFDSISVTGTSTVAMPATPSGSQIVNVDYVTDHADPLKYATNCITEIPQDIKLELSSGTLTLKAGSKVYVPNGAGVFDEVNIQSDITASFTGSNTVFIYYNQTGNSIWYGGSNSGSSNPSITDFFYNTTDNRVYYLRNGTPDALLFSFPIAICNVNNGSITSINQVFNGFGYIGSTIFALPGVKGLISNGRNADGTLKSTEFTISNVLTSTKNVSLNGVGQLIIKSNEVRFGDYTYQYKYDEANNKFYYVPFMDSSWCNAGTYTISGLSITNFNPKTAFHAVDYSDLGGIIQNARSINPSDAINSIVTTVHKLKQANAGHFVLGNGLIVQWRQVQWTNGNSTGAISWPTSFSGSDTYAVVAGWGNNGGTFEESAYPVTVSSQTASTFTLNVYTGLASTNRYIWVIGVGY